jgi:hypothetical protein
MNTQQAKELLILCRPGTRDYQDPDVRTALDMALVDSELRSWLDRQSDFHVKTRQAIRRIQPPGDLKARILAGRLPEAKIIWWKRPELMALAAALVLLCGLLVFWMPSAGRDKFADYHARMAKTALRDYRMNMVANDTAQIRSFLADHGHPANYQMPDRLGKLPGAGCALLRWNDHPVSLVCLRQPNQDLLWLFVAKVDSFKNLPATSKPEFRQTGKLATATWNRQGLTYILAGIGDKNLIEKYL